MTMLSPQTIEFRRICLELKLTIPTAENVLVDMPSSNTHWYYEASALFRKLGSKRHVIMRVEYETEFNAKREVSGHPLFPPLWVHVRRTDSGHHIRHAFWRGNAPFTAEPASDITIDSIYAECIQSGGFDARAIDRWMTFRN